MLTLEQILETQHQGIRQNAYKYRIVDILALYDISNTEDDMTIKEFRNGTVYITAEDIPKDYYNRRIFSIEPDCNNITGCLYLKIILI